MTIRRWTLLLGALVLGACQAPVGSFEAASVAAETRLVPTSYAPAARERMFRILREELSDWDRWRATEAGQRPGREADCGGEAERPESRVANFHRVMAYWNATRMTPDYIERSRAEFAARSNGACVAVWGDEAWSAAFISYVMATAGVAAFDFPPHVGHRNYVDHIIRNGDRFGAAASFIARDIPDYAPRAGDLICADRSERVASRITTLAQRRAELGRGREMHCDIVVAVRARSVEVVGGNLGHAVALRTYPTDAAGRLIVRPLAEASPDDRTWFTVIENRMGLLPPFASPPGS